MQKNRDVVNGFVENVLNRGQIDATSDYFWDDMVEQAPFPGQAPGIEGIKGVVRNLRISFPDMHWTIDEQIADGEKVVSRFQWQGTHRGEFLGVPATNCPVTVWGMVIDRLEDARIKETRIIMDTLGLMMQLGVLLPPKT